MADYDHNLMTILSGGLTAYGLADASGASTAITGVMKAAQKFAMLFLTEQGSVPDDPDRGTTFLTALRFGSIKNEFDVITSFTQAVAEALNYFEEVQDGVDIPDDERITDAELVDYSLDAPTVTLRIKVTVEAGASAEIVAPINTLNIGPQEV